MTLLSYQLMLLLHAMILSIHYTLLIGRCMYNYYNLYLRI